MTNRWCLSPHSLLLFCSLILFVLIGSVECNKPSYEGYNIPLPSLPESEDMTENCNNGEKGSKKKSTMIDVRFNTAIRCLLFGPPLPSSSSNNDDIIMSPQQHQRHNEDREEEPLFPINILKDKNLSIFATGERRHETNYFGGLVRWKKNGLMTRTRRNPTTIITELSSEWSLHDPKHMDSMSLRINLLDDVDVDHSAKMVEIRANCKNRLSQIGCRFPLLRRLHLWGILHFPWNHKSFDYPRFHSGHIVSNTNDNGDNPTNDDEWYIPDITVDPLGMVTASNHFNIPLPLRRHDSSLGSSSSSQLLKFRLRVSTRGISLLSNTLGVDDFGGDDDGDHGHRTADSIMYLECNYINKLQGTSTTGRLEVPVDTSNMMNIVNWKNNPMVTDARILLIHERLMK